MMRSHCCDELDVKKGVWTPEEDAKMLAHVSRHGTGNWTTVPKKAGLKRCGKSCRLRWSNYLRPDLKHGSFTSQEEELIIMLHATIGSRWSIIAQQLPGRTDNDVKNHWNTKLKKKLSERGIDPVTHKPFSQILADYGNIGGLPRVSSTRIGSLNKDLKNAFTLKAEESHMFPHDETAVMNNNSNNPESSISQFEFLNGNEIINNQCRTYSTDLLSQLQAIKMFTEASDCSSDTKLSPSLCCESPILLSPSSSSSSTCSAVKSPAANLNWQDYLLEDAFLPAAYSKDQDDKSELVSSNGLASDEVQREFNGAEVIMQQQHGNAVNNNYFRASASSSNHSFVEDMLARDNEMMLLEFSDLLEEPYYWQ